METLIESRLCQRSLLSQSFEMQRIYYEVMDNFLAEYVKRFPDIVELMKTLKLLDRDSESVFCQKNQ